MSIHYGKFVLSAFGGTLSANKYIEPTVEAFKAEFSIAEERVARANKKTKERAIQRLTNTKRLAAFLDEHQINRKADRATARSQRGTNASKTASSSNGSDSSVTGQHIVVTW